MEKCPRESMRNLGNIMDYELSIKDVMCINKILGKKEGRKVHKALTI
tara:strand:- start:354 stop:494 length:141 start_codon:yes stop_codon:yes gene_type:complete